MSDFVIVLLNSSFAQLVIKYKRILRMDYAVAFLESRNVIQDVQGNQDAVVNREYLINNFTTCKNYEDHALLSYNYIVNLMFKNLKTITVFF